ncbi:putative endonuclease [Catalinimonas alkaloidigena]|uniref:Putative endonuclease n=1 Tax=Catalinimonas alkaloidigena TaxID=1075417 RepID=A0A1G9GCH1_9BACT|nr:putative endonuclease [Catalinimonas alkaloidigena]
MEREKEIKKGNRKKKETLIASLNLEWSFLNDEVE